MRSFPPLCSFFAYYRVYCALLPVENKTGHLHFVMAAFKNLLFSSWLKLKCLYSSTHTANLFQCNIASPDGETCHVKCQWHMDWCYLVISHLQHHTYTRTLFFTHFLSLLEPPIQLCVSLVSTVSLWWLTSCPSISTSWNRRLSPSTFWRGSPLTCAGRWDLPLWLLFFLLNNINASLVDPVKLLSNFFKWFLTVIITVGKFLQ